MTLDPCSAMGLFFDCGGEAIQGRGGWGLAHDRDLTRSMWQNGRFGRLVF